MSVLDILLPRAANNDYRGGRALFKTPPSAPPTPEIGSSQQRLLSQ